MNESVRISDVHLTAAGADLAATGLAGWVSFLLDGRLRVDGVAVRRTLDGRLTLAFPGRMDGTGRRRFYLRPLDDEARLELERLVFRALHLEEIPPR